MPLIIYEDYAININNISHIRIVEDLVTKECGMLIFLKGNNKHLPGEQDFTIRFPSRVDADKTLLKISANSENITLI